VIAVLDNDSAAHEAAMALRDISLPSNYAVMHYPDLKLAEAYPTLGPQGKTVMNVNRLAGSIELYLGTDVLTQQDGTLTPIQWKGYMGKIGSYQGEVINKVALQDNFRKKLQAAKRNADQVRTQDWSGLSLILEAIITKLSAL